MVELTAPVTPQQYRVFLSQQNLPPEHIDQVMQQIVVRDGYVVGVPAANLAPPAGHVPAGVATPKPNRIEKLGAAASEKIGELRTKINEKINDMARDAARDQGFGASVVDIQAKVIPSKMDPNVVTVRTVIELDSTDLGLQFNGSGGKLLPRGGYTVTVDLPYRYRTDAGDNIVDVAKQEYDRLKNQLRGAFRAVSYNPERNANELPPSGTTITRHLLAGFKGSYALENLGVAGEAVTQFTVQHRFGEDGKIQLSVSENRLRKIGGKPHITLNDLQLHGGTTVQQNSERGVRLEVDVIRPGNDDNSKRRERADRELLGETVRFNDHGLPQRIDYRAAADRSAVRTARLAKQLDTSAGAGYSFGAIGLSASHAKHLLSVYESRHAEANREQADANLATWIQAVEASNPSRRADLMGRLRRAPGADGAVFTATAENDDAASLAASFGKTLGTSHVRLQLAARFGERIKDCNTIKRTLRIAPDGDTASMTFDALDSRQFVTTLMDFDAGLRVQASLKNAIRGYTDDVVAQVESSFSAGKWLENLDLQEKVGDAAYDLIKENVEKVALSFDATRESGSWGRVTFTASNISNAAIHDEVVAQMMAGDFKDAVAAGVHLTTSTSERQSFKAKVNFDFAGLLSYAMERSHGVIDEKTVWEFNGKRFQIREMKGEASKRVESLNTTDFQLRTYYVSSVGEDGQPIEGLPTQAITTMVYTSKEKNVARDKEAGRVIGMADALNFDTFVPLQPERATGLGASLLRIFRGIDTLRGGTIVLAAATSTEGHIAALTRTPDEAERIGVETAKALLRTGASPTPELAAQVYDLGGMPQSDRLELASFIQKYFWGSVGSFTGGFPVGAPGWNNRIDPDEVDPIRRRIQDRLDDPPQRTVNQGDDRAVVEAWNRAQRAEVERIRSLLPEGGVAALPNGFILTAGASSILEDGLRDPEDEASSARATYERTYNRSVADERFIRAMGQWARTVASDPNVAAMRARLQRGEKPSDEEVHALLTKFVAMAAENTQGSTAIFSDDKDLLSLAHWTILLAMAGEENVLGMARVQAGLGSFAAGSSADLTPAAINERRTAIQASVAQEKQRLDHETHQ